ncbi:uncharacterized protein K02A2.6-like [Ostrea edulis]|uniref:uncharacterized protein K02A2.6-like n=1 Tax=Ostrea edulis TaxID=37623 RepID=UPI0024AF16FE|nr:uncharacterized protein K02A2.6-like [Ostrea edulis]
MEQPKPPNHLSMEGNLAENWKEWIQGFELYLTATGIGEKDEKVQVATFLHMAGIEARRVYNTFGITGDDVHKIEVLKTKFKEYCEPRKNLTYIRHVFFTRNQGHDEPTDNYVTDLRNKAQQCEFGSLADELIRDRIVCGIQDEACRARLLRESDLTLAKAIDVCRAQEMSTKQLKSLKGSEEQAIAAIRVPPNADSDADTELFIGTLLVNKVDQDRSDWVETLTINDRKVEFKLDTGAQGNIIPKHVFDQLELDDHQLKNTKIRSVAYGGHKIKPKGTKILECSVRGRKYDLPFFIVDTNARAILGKNACTEIGSIVRVHCVKNESTKENVLKAYDDVFKGLGELPGKHHIKIDETITPVIHPPRKVPAALQDKVRTELDRMETLGVITKQDEPTDWVHSLVTVRKPNKLRLCIDPKDLNRAIKREHYHLQTVDEVIEKLPQAKVFSKFDATHGFWHIKLDEPSSKLLTFNTPFGRYRYMRLPFGISSAPEVFSKRVQEMFSDLSGVECIVDDILVWGETTAEHDSRVQQMLQRCREMNFKLNKNKVEFRVPEVRYVGHLITNNGIKVDPEKVRAIVEMPPPDDVSGVKRVLGVVQYVSKFIPNLSDVTAPLRILLQQDVEWHWDAPQQESFDRLKQLVSSTPVLRIYDVRKPVRISGDASSKGLGVVLLQDAHPVAYGSRALTETQKRCAQIEREMLAIVYGCEKFHHYIYGRSVTVETDHKPLVAIYNKPLYRATPRLQRMLMRLQRYDLKLVYVPGKEMHISDALSRSYLKETPEILVDDEIDVDWIEAQLPVSPTKLQQLKEATAADETLQTLKNTVLVGWPIDQSNVPLNIIQFWNYRDEITEIDGLLYKGQRLMIPTSLKTEMLNKLHEAHMGIVKTQTRAREILFWPKMNQNIENFIGQCAVCNKYRNSNSKEPMVPQEIPSRPWAKVAADMFQFKGSEYLLCVDYYSKYPVSSYAYDNQFTNNHYF